MFKKKPWDRKKADQTVNPKDQAGMNDEAKNTGNPHKLLVWCNRFSVPLQFLWCGILYYIIEAVSRHSFSEAASFMTGSPMVFLYNTLLIFTTMSIIYLFPKRIFARAVVSIFWLFLGIVNGVILLNRVTPFTGPDLKLLGDAKKIMSKYLSPLTFVLAVILIIGVVAFLFVLFKRTKRFAGKRNWFVDIAIIVLSAASLFGATKLALSTRLISGYFGNIAFAYQDYGYPYCLAVTLFDTGISQPEDYNEEKINEILASEGDVAESDTSEDVNIIFLQLETFFDPTTVNFLELSEDPIPNFRKLMEEYSSGYLKVPVVGAGTANTEFECITGMSMHYFGAGEYPYKSVLKEQTCESIPYNLRDLGYSTHAIHNNEANFYGRKTVFTRLGFDSFTSQEYMSETSDLTATGWIKDHILTKEIFNCLNSTRGVDYIYTISVQGHGDYPTEPVLDDPVITVSGAEDREKNNYSWEYYVNQLYEMDQFVKDLTDQLSEYDEKVVLVMYGDHLPTMGLETKDIDSRYLYQTNYVIWDNFGLERVEEDLASYQIGAEVLDRLDIHEGTMTAFHQTRKETKNYQYDMELLQYDMLYGDKYVYGGESPYEQQVMTLGVLPITIGSITRDEDGTLHIYGRNFTASTKLEVNGELVEDTLYVSSDELIVRDVKVDYEDEVDIAQQSASSTAKVLTRTDPVEFAKLCKEDNYKEETEEEESEEEASDDEESYIKSAAEKQGDAKNSDSKNADTKSSDTKGSDTEDSDTKDTNTKNTDTKNSNTKTTDSKKN